MNAALLEAVLHDGLWFRCFPGSPGSGSAVSRAAGQDLGAPAREKNARKNGCLGLRAGERW